MLDGSCQKLFAGGRHRVTERIGTKRLTSLRATNENLGTIRIPDTDCVVSDWSTYKPLNCGSVLPGGLPYEFAHETSQHIHVATGRRATCNRETRCKLPKRMSSTSALLTTAAATPMSIQTRRRSNRVDPDSSTSNYKNSVGIVLVAVVCIVLMM